MAPYFSSVVISHFKLNFFKLNKLNFCISDVYSLVTIKQELQFFEPPIEDDYSRQQRHQQQLDYNRQELLQEYYQDYDYLEDLPLTQTGRRNKNKNGGKTKQKRRKRKSDYDDEEDLDYDASIKEEYD